MGTVLLHIPLLGWLLAIVLGIGAMIISLAVFVVWIVQIIKAFSGKEWEMPLIGKYARQHLTTGKFPFGQSTTI